MRRNNLFSAENESNILVSKISLMKVLQLEKKEFNYLGKSGLNKDRENRSRDLFK